MGEFAPNVAELVDHQAERVDSDYEPGSAEHGLYLVKTTCEACHSDTGRYRTPNAPDLQIAKAYNKQQFVRLIRTGIALGEREIDHQMSEAAEYRYIYLTDTEVDALFNYLSNL